VKEVFLVTTALEETWPEDSQSILFLGEWCRLYSRRHHWTNLDSTVLPYHWDDRLELYEDYKYLREFIELLLTELTGELNKLHDVCHSTRYWRILVGPWLTMFVPIIYDRWKCVNLALDNFSISETRVHEELNLDYIPQSMEHFSNLFKSELWNHAVYASILKFLEFKKITYINNTGSISHRLVGCPSVKKNIVARIKERLCNFTTRFSRNDTYFIISTYLSNVDNIKLQLKLGQFPVMYRGGI